MYNLEITEDNLYEEISGDQRGKLYYRVSEVDGVNKINYIYIIEENNLKLMIDIFYSQEVEEGIGTYIRNMVNSIK